MKILRFARYTIAGIFACGLAFGGCGTDAGSVTTIDLTGYWLAGRLTTVTPPDTDAGALGDGGIVDATDGGSGQLDAGDTGEKPTGETWDYLVAKQDGARVTFTRLNDPTVVAFAGDIKGDALTLSGDFDVVISSVEKYRLSGTVKNSATSDTWEASRIHEPQVVNGNVDPLSVSPILSDQDLVPTPPSNGNHVITFGTDHVDDAVTVFHPPDWWGWEHRAALHDTPGIQTTRLDTLPYDAWGSQMWFVRLVNGWGGNTGAEMWIQVDGKTVWYTVINWDWNYTAEVYEFNLFVNVRDGRVCEYWGRPMTRKAPILGSHNYTSCYR